MASLYASMKTLLAQGYNCLPKFNACDSSHLFANRTKICVLILMDLEQGP